jgi:hypothetical protein
MSFKHGKTQRRKTGGSFNSFITADNNRAHYESGKTRKGIDVKLEKDRTGKPIAWLIGGDAPWDESFEELKKGAKGGRYKSFIAELFKTYPRFNNFTQSDRGIKISHAMFCKLFMHDSVLGRMYPMLIAKVNKTPQLKCAPIRAVEPVVRAMEPIVREPVVRVQPVVRAMEPVVRVQPVVRAMEPVVRAMEPVVRAMEPVVREPVVRVRDPMRKSKSLSRKNFPDQRFIDQRFIDQRFIDQRFPDQRFMNQRFPDQRFMNQRFLDQRFMNQSFLNQSFLNQRLMDQSFLNQNQSFLNQNQIFGRQSFGRQSFGRQSFGRQSFPRRTRRIESIDPAIRDNVKTLTAMGFQTQIIMKALMKHNNNIVKAIDELTSLQNMTHHERMAHHGFTTTIQLLKLTARKNFIIRNHGGSGDCLFLSLYDTLTRADPNVTRNKTPHDIRLEIVNYIMTNLNRYQNKTTGQTFKNAIQHGIVVNGKTLHINNYADEMRKQGTYGTDLEISAAAQLYKINIYVVNQDGISFDQLYIGNHPSDWQNTWYIFNLNNSHYTSLLCDDGPGGCPH